MAEKIMVRVPRKPDLVGSLDVFGGVKLPCYGWVNTSEKGVKYIRLTVKIGDSFVPAGVLFKAGDNDARGKGVEKGNNSKGENKE